jgi:GntR family transcriptional regulator / MocR family aminotransferase
MRAAYALRRDTLADALRRHVGDVLDVEASAGGMHLIGWLREDFVSSATETRSSRSRGSTRASRALNAAQGSATADTRRASGTLSRDVSLAHGAERLGLAPEPLSTWYVDAPPSEALLMSFTNVPPDGAEDVARRLADAFARPYA